MIRLLTQDLEDKGSISCSSTDFLRKFGQVKVQTDVEFEALKIYTPYDALQKWQKCSQSNPKEITSWKPFVPVTYMQPTECGRVLGPPVSRIAPIFPTSGGEGRKSRALCQ